MKNFKFLVALVSFWGALAAPAVQAATVVIDDPWDSGSRTVIRATEAGGGGTLVTVAVTGPQDGDKWIGMPLMGLPVAITTSRNQPGSGWEPEVEQIFPLNTGGKTDDQGQAAFLIRTKFPAGTTLFVTVGGKRVGSPDGLPILLK